MAKTFGDFVIERLYDWGVRRRIFGYPGDGINGCD
jgi:pyruvate dehydrogenase (quinone)